MGYLLLGYAIVQTVVTYNQELLVGLSLNPITTSTAIFINTLL